MAFYSSLHPPSLPPTLPLPFAQWFDPSRLWPSRTPCRCACAGCRRERLGLRDPRPVWGRRASAGRCQGLSGHVVRRPPTRLDAPAASPSASWLRQTRAPTGRRRSTGRGSPAGRCRPTVPAETQKPRTRRARLRRELVRDASEQRQGRRRPGCGRWSAVLGAQTEGRGSVQMSPPGSVRPRGAPSPAGGVALSGMERIRPGPLPRRHSLSAFP